MKYLFFRALLIAATLAFLFIGQSCDPIDDTDDTDTIPWPYTDTLDHNDTFMSYWNMPVGSWWVYKRTDTDIVILDTAKVIANTKKYFVVLHLVATTTEMFRYSTPNGVLCGMTVIT